MSSGSLDMGLHLSDSLSERYDGAFALRFDAVGGLPVQVDFMYIIDNQGLRIEYVPQTSLDGITVVRRASSPVIINFFRNETADDRPMMDYSYQDSRNPFADYDEYIY